MKMSFNKKLKQLRTENNLSQKQLADKLFVSRPTLANWENGRRLPDIVTIKRIASFFNIDVETLLETNDSINQRLEVVVLDDEKIILSNSLSTIEKVLPDASIIGFTKASEIIEYAKYTKINIAFVDIEIGTSSGLEVCKQLLSINPDTNAIFLTAFKNYAFDAWQTGACGYLLKPLTEDELNKQLQTLRHPIK